MRSLSRVGTSRGLRPGPVLPVRSLTWAAMLIALSVVLTRIGSVRIAFGAVEAIRIGFGALPILLAGVAGGPGLGFLVGAAADAVGYGLNPMGAYVPLITLSSGLLGLIPGLVMRSGAGRPITLGRVALAVGAAQALVGIFLTPWFLHLSFGIPYAVLIPPRLVAKPIEIVLFTIIVHMVAVPLVRRGLLPATTGR